MILSGYQPETMSRADVDAINEPTLLVFGVNWCPHCQAAAAPLQEALAHLPALRVMQVEDGKGRALGRTFGVKLWPTLVFMRGGKELGRLVRPTQAKEVTALLAAV